MTTPDGRAYAIRRIYDCTTLPELERYWSFVLGKSYQRDAEVQAAKDAHKAKLAGVTA